MHSSRLNPLALVAVACVLYQARAADKVAMFSSLPEGDELEMTFTASGCSHFATFELKFHRSESLAVSIVQLEGEWSRDRQVFASTNRVALGDLTLTKADVEGLDKLLGFYRSGPRDGCTTVDKISISQRHDDKIDPERRDLRVPLPNP
jgi:hypothetical protein